MSDDTSVSFRTFGTPGAERLVMLVGTPIAVSLDPLPTETAARDICVLALAVEGAAIEDPGTFGSETPAEQTASSLVGLIRASLETLRPRLDAGTPLTVGLVAYREAADVALHARPCSARRSTDWPWSPSPPPRHRWTETISAC